MKFENCKQNIFQLKNSSNYIKKTASFHTCKSGIKSELSSDRKNKRTYTCIYNKEDVWFTSMIQRTSDIIHKTISCQTLFELNYFKT